jgi:hypothetical protein
LSGHLSGRHDAPIGTYHFVDWLRRRTQTVGYVTFWSELVTSELHACQHNRQLLTFQSPVTGLTTCPTCFNNQQIFILYLCVSYDSHCKQWLFP